MTINKENDSASVLKQSIIIKVNRLHVPIKKSGKDIVLNVSFREGIIRYIITIFLPILVLLIDKHLIIYTAPIMAYLFFSGITHFCFIKYAWHRFIMHDPPAMPPAYGKSLNYPEESL